MANFLLNNRFISMDLAQCNRRNCFILTIGFAVAVVLYQRDVVKRSVDQFLETIRIRIYRIFKKKIPTDKQLEEFSYDGIELPEHPMGIPNLKNKCFMNSLLQVMVWTPRFAKQLFKQLELDNNKQAEMSRSILKLLYVHYKFPEEHVVDESIPKCIVRAVRKINSQFEGDNQEDSFEIFNTILSGIEDEGLTILNVSTDCEYKEKESDLPVSTLFRGKLVSKWSFFSCPHEEDITQVFTSLSVPVGHVLKQEDDKELKSNTEQRGHGTEENREDVEENDTGHVPSKNSSEEENCEAESDEKEDNVYKNELINDTAQIKEDDKELKSNAEQRGHGTEENREDVDENDTGNVPNKNSSESGVVSTRDITDVEKGLSELMKQEEFDEELIGCRKCTNREPDGKSRKTLKVSHPPPVLVLQINRFEIDYSGQLSKVQQKMTYPSILDLSPFCEDGREPVKYSLYGVVNHIGDIHGGHYSAHIKTKNRNTKFLEELVEGKRSKDCVVPIDIDQDPGWYYVSDTFVRKSTEDRALSLGGAYILMYERIKTEIKQ